MPRITIRFCLKIGIRNLIGRAIEKRIRSYYAFEILLMTATKRKHEDRFHQCPIPRQCEVDRRVQCCPTKTEYSGARRSHKTSKGHRSEDSVGAPHSGLQGGAGSIMQTSVQSRRNCCRLICWRKCLPKFLDEFMYNFAQKKGVYKVIEKNTQVREVVHKYNYLNMMILQGQKVGTPCAHKY